MAKRNPYTQQRKNKNRSGGGGRTTVERETPVYELKPVVTYGKPFIVMEDTDKNTFAYNGSAWVPYSLSMDQCRSECQVKVLPQKVNGKTRYEVRAPVPT